MISPDAMERIEEQAFEKYVENGMATRMGDDHLTGEIPVWRDADDSYMVPAECTIPGDLIKDWLYDDFRAIVERYLKIHSAESIHELPQLERYDPVSPIDYFECCMEMYEEIEDYFWYNIYPDKQQEYFEAHAERTYD